MELLLTRSLWEALAATIYPTITPSTFLAPFFYALKRSGEAGVQHLVKTVYGPLFDEIEHRIAVAHLLMCVQIVFFKEGFILVHMWILAITAMVSTKVLSQATNKVIASSGY